MKTLNRRDFAVDLGLALAAAILLPATTARADDMEVHIDNFVFQPAELKIKVGTTVTWFKPGRHPPHRGVGRQVQVQDPGHRRQVLLHLHQRGRLQIFLFVAPAHDGDDQG
ncbi:plastocyanin [Bradyrhizobium sp. LB1.3]